ncbi:hypothetical protein SNEBB_001790 [Seison nebaliae]|nr:hypothetical protein SNEBB_001790 [Seison nebaliae]
MTDESKARRGRSLLKVEESEQTELSDGRCLSGSSGRSKTRKNRTKSEIVKKKRRREIESGGSRRNDIIPLRGALKNKDEEEGEIITPTLRIVFPEHVRHFLNFELKYIRESLVYNLPFTSTTSAKLTIDDVLNKHFLPYLRGLPNYGKEDIYSDSFVHGVIDYFNILLYTKLLNSEEERRQYISLMEQTNLIVSQGKTSKKSSKTIRLPHQIYGIPHLIRMLAYLSLPTVACEKQIHLKKSNKLDDLFHHTLHLENDNFLRFYLAEHFTRLCNFLEKFICEELHWSNDDVLEQLFQLSDEISSSPSENERHEPIVSKFTTSDNDHQIIPSISSKIYLNHNRCHSDSTTSSTE